MTMCKISWLFLIICVININQFVLGQKVLLRDVSSLTLYNGEYTTGRRSSPVPQLQCVGGTAAGKFALKAVQCYNRGFDGLDVQWECKADMDHNYQFGKISVTCEGYDHPNDPYILAGSCGLKYELDYSRSGAKNFGYSGGKIEETHWMEYVVYFIVAAFIVYLIYLTCTSPREGYEGDRFHSGSWGGNDDPRGPPHPPGWRPPPPSYNETFPNAKGTFGQGTSSSGQDSGPGFYSGLGLGALGGYLFGRSNDGSSAYQRRPYRSGYRSQYERDTGYYDGPSTSHHNSSGSSGTHTSTGFGGTERR